MGEGYSKEHWQRDEKVLSCANCKVAFSFTIRRHHCRNCGAIFCSKCAFRFAPLVHRNMSSPVRICENCFFVIVTNSEQSNGTSGDPTNSSGGQNRMSSSQVQQTALLKDPVFGSMQPVVDQPQAATLTNIFAAVRDEANQNLVDIVLAAVVPVTLDHWVDSYEKELEFSCSVDNKGTQRFPLGAVNDWASLIDMVMVVHKDQGVKHIEIDVAQIRNVVNQMTAVKTSSLLI